jgi:hypothetical protein
MKTKRTEPGVRLTCLTQQRLIDALDIDHLVDELADGVPPPFLTPSVLCEQTLVVVATEPESGRYLGLLGGRKETLPGGLTFLQLEMACTAFTLRGRRLISALLACAALESAEHVPVFAARTGSPSWFRALRHFASRVEGAAFHPTPAGAVVVLRAAAMGQEIARAICPEQRYDVATGMLHGAYSGLPRLMPRYSSADAWFATAEAAPTEMPGRLLAVVDLRGASKASLLAIVRRATLSG